MSLPGRPNGEFLRAEPEGSPVSGDAVGVRTPVAGCLAAAEPAGPLAGALPVARYRFEARMQARLPLPDYAGSLLRGAFGAALRRSVCMTGLPLCADCPLYRSCPYPALFETPPRETPLRQRFSQVPNPYVIEPPALGTRVLAEGQPLVFHMVLTGQQALAQLPLVVHAWARALRHGLGRERVAGELSRLQWVGEGGRVEDVLDPATLNVLEHEATLEPPGGPPPAPDGTPACGAVLRIDTPLRLQRDGHAMGPGELDARALVAALARRVSLMLHLHADHPTLQPVQPLLAAAESLAEDRSGLRWHDWVRYSSRQRQEMTLGGVVGDWVLHGEVAALWPWLWLGQWLHLGKNATMGMGHYRLLPLHV